MRWTSWILVYLLGACVGQQERCVSAELSSQLAWSWILVVRFGFVTEE